MTKPFYFEMSTLSLTATRPDKILLNFDNGVIENAKFAREQVEKAGITPENFGLSFHPGLMSHPKSALMMMAEGFKIKSIDTPTVTDWKHEIQLALRKPGELKNQIGWNLFAAPTERKRMEYIEESLYYRNIISGNSPEEAYIRLNSENFLGKDYTLWNKLINNPQLSIAKFAIEQSEKHSFNSYLSLMIRLNKDSHRGEERALISFDAVHTLQSIMIHDFNKENKTKSPNELTEKLHSNFKRVCSSGLLAIIELHQAKRENCELQTHASIGDSEGLIDFIRLAQDHAEYLNENPNARFPFYIYEPHPGEVRNLSKKENIAALAAIVSKFNGKN